MKELNMFQSEAIPTPVSIVPPKESPAILLAKTINAHFKYNHSSPGTSEVLHLRHDMHKEIYAQKNTIEDILNINRELFDKAAEMIKSSNKVILLGCGTALQVGHLGTYFMKKIANKSSEHIASSEFIGGGTNLDSNSVVISISQSGETTETVNAIQKAKQEGAKIITITNNDKSTLADLSDLVFKTQCEEEKAVPSTMAATNQMAILALMANTVKGEFLNGAVDICLLSNALHTHLNARLERSVERLAQKYKDIKHIYILGSQEMYPIALEAGIKIKESSYIHAEGFIAPEFRHGPIALLDEKSLVISIDKDGDSKDHISLCKQIQEQGAKVLGISPKHTMAYNDYLPIPAGQNLSMIFSLIPVQLFAYHLAKAKGINPDKPRGLTKSVLLED